MVRIMDLLRSSLIDTVRSPNHDCGTGREYSHLGYATAFGRLRLYVTTSRASAKGLIVYLGSVKVAPVLVIKQAHNPESRRRRIVPVRPRFIRRQTGLADRV